MTKIFLQSSFKSHVSYGGLVYSRMQVYNSKKNPWEFFSRGNWGHSRLHSFPLLPIPIAVGNRIPTVICNAMHALPCCVVACLQRVTSTVRARVLSKAPPNVTPTVAPVDTRLTRLLTSAAQVYTQFVASAVFTCIGALGTPPPPNGAPR